MGWFYGLDKYVKLVLRSSRVCSIKSMGLKVKIWSRSAICLSHSWSAPNYFILPYLYCRFAVFWLKILQTLAIQRFGSVRVFEGFVFVSNYVSTVYYNNKKKRSVVGAGHMERLDLNLTSGK